MFTRLVDRVQSAPREDFKGRETRYRQQVDANPRITFDPTPTPPELEIERIYRA